DANAPDTDFVLIHPREKGMRYSVSHHTGTLYIVTNDNAPNFKVMKAPVADAAKRNWEVLLPHRPEVKVDGIALFA
ncbi:MAG: oligopeptidase B, partial [Gammaproteobacteria bacterium]|nr:oligopeptidase B [Gammaproteobacteria bacterium]NIW49904.1 oligopeptidase B [Gammaproteobacteria bacterium]NIW98120.1 oligopeptidase B [Phycisphaerae bacterium]